MKPIALFTTAGSLEEARTLARAAVERKLAACAQISEIESFYQWKGAVQNEKEWRILFKTTDAQYTAVEQLIRELHSYELPAVYACEMDRVLGAFGEWVVENSKGL
ncbi:MAG: divalent-cation tolerance protein CutA [Steroidobacteraceae bacterium]|nr:divalent-cation tolerance protein CutA [Steroidobacteraceae bacterium]